MLAETRILSDRQSGAIVPYSVAGRPSVDVT
jgi:hypothetical protein